MPSQEALNLLATKLAGGNIINPGGSVGQEYSQLSDQYYSSGQNIGAIPGLKSAYDLARSERNYATILSPAKAQTKEAGGVSYDPYLRDAQGNPIGTRVPPPGSTSESIQRSIEQANKVLARGGRQLTLSREEAIKQDIKEIQRQVAEGRRPPLTQREFEGRTNLPTFYITKPGSYFGEEKGLQYYETDAEGNIIRKFSKSEVKALGLKPAPTGVLQAKAQEDLTFRERVGAEFERARAETEPTLGNTLPGLRDTGLDLGLGVAGTGLGLYDLGYGLLTTPTETIANIPKGLYESYKEVRGGALAQGLRQEPAYFTGYIGSQLLLAKVTGKLVSIPINKAIQKFSVPKTESIVSISLETPGKQFTATALQFETKSGRVGTIKQVSSFKKGGEAKTLALGEVSDVKYVYGEPKLVKTKVFAGEVISKSKIGEIRNVLSDIGGVSVYKPIKAEAIAGRGFVVTSPRNKFLQVNYGTIPAGQRAIQDTALIFRTYVKGLKRTEFYSKGFAFDVGAGTIKGFGDVRAKFLIGATKQIGKGKPSGYAGFSFEKITTPKLDKGFTIKAPGKSYVILSPEQITTIQKAGYSQKNILDLMSIASQSTMKYPSISIKAIPPLMQKQVTESVTTYPRSQYIGTGLYERTTGGIFPGQIERTKLSLDTGQIFRDSSRFLLGLDSGQRSKARERFITPTTQAQAQREVSLSATKFLQAQAQKQQLRTRQLLVTSRVTPRFPTPRIIISRIPFIIPRFGKGKSPKQSAGTFFVSIRKKGKFVPVYKTGDLARAYEVGKGITGRTIFRSFKVTSPSGFAPVRVPKGYRRAKREKNVLVELSKTSLSQIGEQAVVQAGRRAKKKYKRR